MLDWRFLLVVCGLWALAPSTFAATLYIDPPQTELNRGDAQILQIRLDTDEAVGECVNAVSGVLTFAGPIEPVDVSTGASILSVWLESPTVDINRKQVTFAGGIPNGYCGRVDGDPNLTNVLFEVVARAATSPGEPEVATVSFTTDTTAYLNDGLGTQATLDLLPSRLQVAATAGDTVQEPWTDRVESDRIPPQEFSIALEQGETAYPGKYYISFSTTDKQTGIDRYEVMEEPLEQMGSFIWGSASAPWREAVSPFVLNDQSLNSIIRVKAIDKAGNEYIANLIPDSELRTTSLRTILAFTLFGATAIVLVIMISIALILYQRRRRERYLDGLEDLSGHDEEESAHNPPIHYDTER